MPLSIFFWILMIVWLVTSGWVGYSTPPAGRYPILGWSAVIFLLFVVIGWKVFGPVIQ